MGETALVGIETALITGASSGIGAAFARLLAAQGVRPILVARREERLHALADELAEGHGLQAPVLVADLSRPGSAASLFAETERLGLAVDLLVNNAGFGKGGEFTDLPLEVQADMVRLNVQTLMELTWLYLPAMRQRSRGGVINVASTAAWQPVPDLAVYAASKAFVLHFSEAVAEEVAADGVTVMALCPGATATEFWSTVGLWEDVLDSMATPDEVVAQALTAFARRRRVFVHGARNKVVTWGARIGPRRLVTSLARRMMAEK